MKTISQKNFPRLKPKVPKNSLTIIFNQNPDFELKIKELKAIIGVWQKIQNKIDDFEVQRPL